MISLNKKYILIILVDFFFNSEPDHRLLKWIRIRPNDTDPTGSGSETLHLALKLDYFFNVVFFSVAIFNVAYKKILFRMSKEKVSNDK